MPHIDPIVLAVGISTNDVPETCASTNTSSTSTHREIPYTTTAPSYADFLTSHLIPNEPLLIGPDLVRGWPALQLWTRPRSHRRCGRCGAARCDTDAQKHDTRAVNVDCKNNTALGLAAREINWEYLVSRYASHRVSVTDCTPGAADAWGNMPCRDITFGDVVGKWLKARPRKCHCDQSQDERNKSGQRDEDTGDALYVKDWHLACAAGTDSSDGPFYETPDIFKDDWMNTYYTMHTSDDFRFVYCSGGAPSPSRAGVYTPLHTDVYMSYSWSTNIIGHKRWWLFPPHVSPYLWMPTRRVSVSDVRGGPSSVDTASFPDFEKAWAEVRVVEQSPGETIFVPSGWAHQVENTTACVSVNHNWANAANVRAMYEAMVDAVRRVEEALEDVWGMLEEGARERGEQGDGWKEEFTRIVQDVVQHDAGWNWLTFWKMVRHALRTAVAQDYPELVSWQETTAQSQARQVVFPYPPAHLRPPLSFIAARVRPCADDFMKRGKYEDVGEAGKVVREVYVLLDTVDECTRHTKNGS